MPFKCFNPFWHLWQGMPSVHLQWEAEVLSNSKQFWSRCKLSWEEGSQGLHFFVLNSKKSWDNKTKVWMPCPKSLNVHFQAKREKRKEKIIIPYMSSMQAFFFINIMSLFHKVFETVIVHRCLEKVASIIMHEMRMSFFLMAD